MLDGEIVVATPRGLDFDALQQRVHPAASRVARLAAETPASFVAFDLLALEGRELMTRPQAERRLLLEALLAESASPIRLTPMTTDRALALRWLRHFEGAGLDGVIAKCGGPALSAGQARDAEGQAPAHRGLRGGGVSVAQERAPGRRLAAPGPLR